MRGFFAGIAYWIVNAYSGPFKFFALHSAGFLFQRN